MQVREEAERPRTPLVAFFSILLSSSGFTYERKPWATQAGGRTYRYVKLQ